MKHRSSMPSVSNLCWYENLTCRTPLELKSAGGLWTTLPGLKRGQGLATGGTGVSRLVVVVVVCVKTPERESTSVLSEGVTLDETAATTETSIMPTDVTILE